MSQKTIIKEENKVKFKKPKMYKIIMYNDDYTSMEFVIKVLAAVFGKKVPEATKIMYDVHKKGSGIAGVYSYDIAVTKISQVRKMAENESYPLKLSMEEE